VLPSDTRVQVLNNALAQQMLSIAVTYPRPASFVPTRVIEVGAATTFVPPDRPSSPIVSAQGNRFVSAASNRLFTSVMRVPLTKTAAAEPASTSAKPASATHKAPPSAAAKRASARRTPDPSPAVEPEIIEKVLNLSPLTARIGQFVSHVSTIGITSFNRDLQFSVAFADNDVEALVAGGGSLWALTIVDISALTGSKGQTTETTFGALTITGNKFRNLWQARLVSSTVSAMVAFSAIAGNVIMNQAIEDANSLVVVVPNSDGTNVAITAVTGNVLWGTANLPPHTDPTTGAALPNWTTYNFYRQ
jgi:hypothetical protein